MEDDDDSPGGEGQDGFSSDEDGQDSYAAATRRLAAGSGSVAARASRGSQRSQRQNGRGQGSRGQGQDVSSSSREGARLIGRAGSAMSRDRHAHVSLSLQYGPDDLSSGSSADELGPEGADSDEELEEDEEEEDEEEDMSSSPSIPDENIDFDLVYALHNFVATVEGQATVNKGNSLTLLDDSNSYW